MNLVQLWDKQEICNTVEVGEDVCLSWQRTVSSSHSSEEQSGGNHKHYYQQGEGILNTAIRNPLTRKTKEIKKIIFQILSFKSPH